MRVERIDAADWPLTVTVGPSWYGLRIDTDHGSEVRYLDARALTRSTAVTRYSVPATLPSEKGHSNAIDRAHAGARCEEAA